MSNQSIILQPKYVADFRCDGSKCNAKCCGNKWRIRIDVDTYKKYQRIKNPVMRKKILSSIKPSTNRIGFEINFAEGKSCPLLCEDNLCYVQRNLGEEVLSNTCIGYPRSVKNIGKYQFRLLSMTCPVAAEKALFSSDGMNIQQVDIEKDTAAWKLVANDVFRQEISGLWDNWQYYPSAHKQFMAGIFKVLQREKKLNSITPWLASNFDYDEMYNDKYKAINDSLGIVLERYWQHEWLYNVFPFSLQGSLLHNYFAYLISYEICKLMIFRIYDSDKPMNRDDIVNALGYFSTMLDHEHGFAEALVKETEIFESEPLKLMQVLLRLQ